MDIFFEKFEFDYKRSVTNALSAEDVTLELREAGEDPETADLKRPRSGKEARRMRAERISSASARLREAEADEEDGGEGGCPQETSPVSESLRCPAMALNVMRFLK